MTDQAPINSPSPRDLSSIDEEYSKLCIHYGDLTLKLKNVQRQLGILELRAKELFAERDLHKQQAPSV
jgi:hypothetical protein